MFCPHDCHECHEPLCHRACQLTGEAPLATCSECGELGVSVTRIYICGECTPEDGSGETGTSGAR